jgi:hypothetical protein
VARPFRGRRGVIFSIGQLDFLKCTTNTWCLWNSSDEVDEFTKIFIYFKTSEKVLREKVQLFG